VKLVEERGCRTNKERKEEAGLGGLWSFVCLGLFLLLFLFDSQRCNKDTYTTALKGDCRAGEEQQVGLTFLPQTN
jgi:hypothetical protein